MYCDWLPLGTSSKATPAWLALVPPKTDVPKMFPLAVHDELVRIAAVAAAVHRAETVKHGVAPPLPAGRAELEQRAESGTAAEPGHAVEVAGGIQDRHHRRRVAVGAVAEDAEIVQDAFFPLCFLRNREQLVSDAFALAAALRGDAVQWRRPVIGQARSGALIGESGKRLAAVGAVALGAETMDDRVRPYFPCGRRGQFEDGAVATSAEPGNAKEVAVRVDYQIADGRRAVGAGSLGAEAVDPFEFPSLVAGRRGSA